MTEDKRRFILNSKTFEIPYQFQKMGVIDINILKQLNENHEYHILSKVSENVFKDFIQYLINGRELDIHFDNIYELTLLSEEFNIQEMKENLDTIKSNYRSHETIIEKMQQQIKLLENQISQQNTLIEQYQSEKNSFITKKELLEATKAGRKYWEEHMSKFPNINWATNSYYSWNRAVVYSENLLKQEI